MNLRLEDFAEETGIFGLNLMRQRVPKIENLFWLIATITFTAFTIHDLRGIVLKYAERQTLTSVRLNNDKSITFDPSPITYLRIRKKFVPTNINVSNDTLMNILETTFSQTKLPETIPDLLFHINIRLFDHISYGIEQPSINPIYQKGKRIDWDLATVYNFYRKNNISLTELQKAAAAMLCTKIGLSVTLPGEENITNICEPNFLVEMHGFRLFFKLSLTPMTFNDSSPQLSLYIDKSSVQFVDRIYIDLYGFLSIWNWENMNSRVMKLDLPENQNTGEKISLAIQPVLRFHEEKRANFDCTTEKNGDCLARCAAQQFYNCTRCWPIGAPFHLLPSNDTEICPGNRMHTLAITLECCFPNITNSWTYFTKCDSFCKAQPPPCHVQIFTHRSDITTTINDKFTVFLNIPSFSFPVFKERLALSWDTFLAQFGGSLGLYLGLSFASLVHIPVFCIRLLASIFLDKFHEKPSQTIHFEAQTNEEIEIRFGPSRTVEVEALSSSQYRENYLLRGEIFTLGTRLAAVEKFLKLQNFKPAISTSEEKL